jgi:hypothetical protein
MHTHRLQITLAAVAVAAATALAGCGGSGSSSNGVESKSPKQIVTIAQQTAEAAKSVHVTGLVNTTEGKLGLDLRLTHGEGAKGTISQGPLSVELVQLGGSAYIKGSAAFYQRFAGAEAARLLQGKWLKAPVTTTQFAPLVSLAKMHRLFTSALGPLATFSKTGTTTVRGQKVVAVEDHFKGGHLYVATTGKPYPVEIARAGSSGGTIRFAEWNAPVSIKAPSDSIDISKLKAGA